MKLALALILATLASCQADGLGLVVKGHVEGTGIVASNGKRTLIFARGTAEAGLYQVDSDGELRLTRPAVAAHDAIRVIDRTIEPPMDVTVAIGEPLPAWTEPTVRALLTSAQIAELGLTWEAGI